MELDAPVTDERRLLTRGDLARLLGTTRMTVNGWASREMTVPFPHPASERRGKEMVYDRAELVAWFREQSDLLAKRDQGWWADYFDRHYRTLTNETG